MRTFTVTPLHPLHHKNTLGSIPMDYSNENANLYFTTSTTEDFDSYPFLSLTSGNEEAGGFWMGGTFESRWGMIDQSGPKVDSSTSIWDPTYCSEHRGHSFGNWYLTCHLQMRWPHTRHRPTAIVISRRTRTSVDTARSHNPNPSSPVTSSSHTPINPYRRFKLDPTPSASQTGMARSLLQHRWKHLLQSRPMLTVRNLLHRILRL